MLRQELAERIAYPQWVEPVSVKVWLALVTANGADPAGDHDLDEE